jgi:F0F1-type ATP synthase membrane subunit b/b'
VHLTLIAAEKVVEESLDDEIHRKLIERTIERLEEDLPYHSLNE